MRTDFSCQRCFKWYIWGSPWNNFCCYQGLKHGSILYNPPGNRLWQPKVHLVVHLRCTLEQLVPLPGPQVSMGLYCITCLGTGWQPKVHLVVCLRCTVEQLVPLPVSQASRDLNKPPENRLQKPKMLQVVHLRFTLEQLVPPPGTQVSRGLYCITYLEQTLAAKGASGVYSWGAPWNNLYRYQCLKWAGPK